MEKKKLLRKFLFKQEMKKNWSIKSIFLLGFVLFFSSEIFAQKADTIIWLSFEEMQVKQKKEPKKVLVDVSADWCVWCKRQEAILLENKTLVNYLNENFYLVMLKPEDDKKIEFKGKTYGIRNFNSTSPGESRRVNLLAVELMGENFIYPSIIFLNENLDLISVFKGYQKKENLDPILSFFATDSYLSIKWSEYSKKFQSILK